LLVWQLKMRERKPWATDPRYFKHVKISALALLKMAMHGNKFSKVLHIVTLHNKYIRVLTFSEFLSARSGGQMEVMGILQGKLEDNTFVVMDAFALPVEGTESKTF
jgi:COP9 signalosome complex subunit 5